MKKTIMFFLLTALLLTSLIPMTAVAEEPKDYAENLVAYWNFEGVGNNRLVDKGDASTHNNNVLLDSCITKALTVSGSTLAVGYTDPDAEITIANGKATVPVNIGHALKSKVFNTGDDIGGLEKMTLGMKVSANATSAGGMLVYRTNGFGLAIGSFDKTNQTYTLQYWSAGSNKDGFTGDPFNGKQFDNNKEYYLFLTVSANNDRTAHVTGYWSEDGKNFTVGTTLTLSLATNAPVGKLWVSGVDATPIYWGKGQNVGVKKGAAFTYDDMWIFNTTVAAASLSTIVQNKLHYATDNETVAAPAYRGLQISPVTDNSFSVRLVATVDSLSYAEVGYEVKVTNYKGAAGTTPKVYSTTEVYESITGKSENGVGGAVTYYASDLGGAYLYALAINGIPADGAVTFEVSTYYKATAAGDRVLGDAYTVTVENGRVVAQTVVTPEA